LLIGIYKKFENSVNWFIVEVMGQANYEASIIKYRTEKMEEKEETGAGSRCYLFLCLLYAL
jgi:hypothetical protein